MSAKFDPRNVPPPDMSSEELVRIVLMCINGEFEDESENSIDDTTEHAAKEKELA